MTSPLRPRLPIRFLWAVAVALAVASGAAAQSGTLRGFATDATDGQPLIGVNVLLENADASVQRGASTNTDGYYAIADLPVGTYRLRATYIGYETRRDTVVLERGTQTYSFALQPGAAELGTVSVSANRPTGAAEVTAGLQRIQAQDIALVPAPDVTGDLANYLVTLPSVVTSGDQGGQLFIRGGEPSQNQVRLDGIPIYQPFHLLGFYSAFPADIVSNVDFSAGGYGARYGGFLSSVLDVSARQGSKRGFVGTASASPFVAAASVEGPLVRDRLSVMLSGRQAVVKPIGSKIVGRDLPYEFSDLFGKLHATPSESTQLSITAIQTSDDGLVGDTASVATSRLTWTNKGLGARLFYVPPAFNLTGEVVLSYSEHAMEKGVGDARQSSSIDRFGAEFDLTHTTRFGDINFGGALEAFALDATLGRLFVGLGGDDRRTFTEAAAYVEPDITFGPLQLRAGLRFTTSPTQGATFWEPRGRVILALGRHQLSGAAGAYHQTLVGLNDRRDATSLFTAWTTAPAGRNPKGIHLIGGYKGSITRAISVATEGFYKTFEDISVSEFSSSPQFSTRLIPADGAAAGADARLEVRGAFGSLSATYALAVVRYQTSSPAYAVRYGTPDLAFNPGHDRRHQASVFGSTQLRGFTLTARWQYGSGLPFSQALGFDRFLYIGDGPIDPLTNGGEPRVIYSDPFNARLPDYHRFDVSVDREFDLPVGALTVQAGLINAYDRRNLLAFDVFTLRRTDQLPFFPVLGAKLEIK